MQQRQRGGCDTVAASLYHGLSRGCETQTRTRTQAQLPVIIIAKSLHRPRVSVGHDDRVMVAARKQADRSAHGLHKLGLHGE